MSSFSLCFIVACVYENQNQNNYKKYSLKDAFWVAMQIHRNETKFNLGYGSLKYELYNYG